MIPAVNPAQPGEGLSMDSKFLEFWGNVLLSAAKGQEQAEGLIRLAREGFGVLEQQMALFEKFWNLDKKPDPPAASTENWTKASADFVKSYQEFIGFMGMVPRQEHEELLKEHEVLKGRLADLEEELRRRKRGAGEEAMDSAIIVKGFEDLMKKQSEQFQCLMNSYGQLYEAEKAGRKSSKTHRPRVSEKRG